MRGLRGYDVTGPSSCCQIDSPAVGILREYPALPALHLSGWRLLLASDWRPGAREPGDEGCPRGGGGPEKKANRNGGGKERGQPSLQALPWSQGV